METILLNFTKGLWNDCVCNYYRLSGVYDNLKCLTDIDMGPYWLDKNLETYEHFIITYVFEREFPGTSYLDIDCENYIGECMWNTYDNFIKEHTESPMLINDSILVENFAPRLYNNIINAANELLTECKYDLERDMVGWNE